MQSNRVLAIGNTGGFVQGPTIATGVWNNYQAVMNFDTPPVSGFLNGNLFALIGFCDPSTDLNFVYLGQNNAGGQSTGSGYWDNL